MDGQNHLQINSENENLMNVCLSQPEFPGMEGNDMIQINLDRRPVSSFSQPAHVEDLLLCTQLQTIQYTQSSQVLHDLSGKS